MAINSVNDVIVGATYRRKDGALYQLIAYCEQPSACLESLVTGHRIDAAIGSNLFQEFDLFRVVCPHCGGDKHIPIPISDSGDVLDCELCAAEGFLAPEQFARYQEGRKLRKERLERRVPMRVEAERLGIDPSELWRRENGLS